MKVVIKVNQLESVLHTIGILKEPIRASVKLRLQKIYKAVNDEYNIHTKEINELIVTFADPIPKEDGDPVDKQSYKLKPEHTQEYNDKVKDIFDAEVELEVPSIDMNMLCTDASDKDIIFTGNYNLLLIEEYFSEKK